MGRILTLVPEFGALGNTKTMLLVDYDKAETGKLHRIFYNGVGADENLHRTIEQSLEYFFPTFSLDDTCEQGHTDVHSLEELHDGLQMLFGKDFRRSHDTGLVAVVDGDEHRHECYEGLATANIALEQTVHLATRSYIGTNLPNHPLLGLRQWEW